MIMLKTIFKNIIRVFIVPLVLSMIFIELIFLCAKLPLVIIEFALKVLDAQLKEIDAVFASIRKYL